MPLSVTALLRRPSAWLPLMMSAGALALVLGYAALAGPGQAKPHDELAPARLFQLILIAEVLVMGFFALRWLPRSPGPAAVVLALQVVAASVPIITVLVLESQI
jgi:hypothetical protein